MKVSDQLEPTVFVIFGGAGDLAWRKLVPALFDLFQNHDQPAKFAIIALDRTELSDEELRQRLHNGVDQFTRLGKVKADVWNHFASHIHYQRGDFKKQETYTSLADQCLSLEKKWGSKAQRIFYMATPPSMFSEIPKYLGESKLAIDTNLARIVVEKPIGYDLESAQKLNVILADNFKESQIFRIDHYLGKETVQNILAFRFANPLFEPIWNRRYVDYVTITVAEDVGVEHRGGYYDGAGALRDMVQNHLMQLLCLVAMEPMVSFDANDIRSKKVDVLRAVRPISHDEVDQNAVRGQYGKGGDGAILGYREEEGVASHSQTETFVALRLWIDNWRWQDVPFYLCTGKRLQKKVSEVSIQFRAVPHRSFPPDASKDWQSSRLVISIQPEEEIVLRFLAKYPGAKMQLSPVDMRFNYNASFATPLPLAYETLLWDILKEDATQFMRVDQVEAAWRSLMPILEVWRGTPPSDFPNYAAGTWGPENAVGLFAQRGHHWPIP